MIKVKEKNDYTGEKQPQEKNTHTHTHIKVITKISFVNL